MSTSLESGRDGTVQRVEPRSISYRDDRSRRPSKIDQFGSYRFHWMTFLVLVVLPTAVMAVYSGLIQSDRYAVEFRFGVRQSNVPVVADDLLSKLTYGMPKEGAGRDAYMLASYIQSRNIVAALDSDGWIRTIFSRPDVDTLSRIDPAASQEHLWRYWRSMVAVSVDRISGLVLTRVQAFTPDDALALAVAVKRDAERMIELTQQRNRRDELKAIEDELLRAGERHAEALVALRAVREAEGTVDPAQSIEERGKTLAGALREKLSLERELAVNSGFISPDAPQLRVLRDRIRALDDEVRRIGNSLANAAGSATAASTIGRFEASELERRFSEKLLQATAEAYSKARLEADRQHLYVTSFVDPLKPERPEFPRRSQNVLLVGILAFFAWAIMLLIVAAAKDHKLNP
jgi:capsular polysaccharide transport system permease protein